jgi:carbonic anhydrase/acetyltransferase-like protein (isoleucine patch superfamily)
MPVYAFENHRPSIGAATYVSPTAQIIGKVIIGGRCYVGHGAVLRGDFGAIEIGDETAVEEGVIVHSRPDDSDFAEVGAGAIVGEMALGPDPLRG